MTARRSASAGVGDSRYAEPRHRGYFGPDWTVSYHAAFGPRGRPGPRKKLPVRLPPGLSWREDGPPDPHRPRPGLSVLSGGLGDDADRRAPSVLRRRDAHPHGSRNGRQARGASGRHSRHHPSDLRHPRGGQALARTRVEGSERGRARGVHAPVWRLPRAGVHRLDRRAGADRRRSEGDASSANPWRAVGPPCGRPCSAAKRPRSAARVSDGRSAAIVGRCATSWSTA